MNIEEATIIEKIKGYNEEKMVLVTALVGKHDPHRLDRFETRLREIDEVLSKLKDV